jgi:hypothetical protein
MLTENVVGARRAGSNSLVPLDTLGGLAKASIAAGDKATDKAERHYKSAGLYLSENKERVAHTKNLTWPGYLIKYCPIGRRQADYYIDVAEGRTSWQEIRATKNESSKAAHAKTRAAARAFSELNSSKSSENHQQKQQQQEENIAAGNNQESAPRKHVNIAPDPRLKIIGQITLKTRDANLSELQSVNDFFAKLLSKRKAGSLN